MSFYPHSFEAEIVPHFVGTYRYTAVFLPADMIEALPLDRYPRLRVSGEVGDIPFSGAWQPVRGRWYLMLSKALLKDGGYAIGDRVEVRFRVEDQETVDVPDILERALEADADAMAAWQAASAGKRRGWAYRIAAAKADATRQRRLDEVLKALTGD